MVRGDIFKCDICGMMVEINVQGGGKLVCCGENMSLVETNTVDASQEKHIPSIEKRDDGFLVKIGSIPHPMTVEHYIQFVEIITESGKSYKQFIEPTSIPEVFFENIPDSKFIVREYCNLHGLWEVEYKE
ncbi:MAG: desulfoferrodoxin FeS4 iron-binding domain-containing protein [Rickettsiales bacterium]|jgi:superoxide reductase|nr:desulfoferrodoxin FeS4 iron-binding domain-containing protein [Rickettsiales bacterium]